jgi:hypothetical protein
MASKLGLRCELGLRCGAPPSRRRWGALEGTDMLLVFNGFMFNVDVNIYINFQTPLTTRTSPKVVICEYSDYG